MVESCRVTCSRVACGMEGLRGPGDHFVAKPVYKPAERPQTDEKSSAEK